LLITPSIKSAMQVQLDQFKILEKAVDDTPLTESYGARYSYRPLCRLN
jgi:hypothetical protein